jgi:hypothetical protein
MAMSPRNKRALAGLTGVAVAALAAGAFFFFTSGGGQEPGSTPVAPAAPAPKAPKKDGKDAKPAKHRTPKFAFFGGRDPFVPLVVADTSGGVASVGSPGGGQQVADQTTVGGHDVSLIDINGDRVQVSVDGQTYNVEPGESFAGNFELVSVSGGCANFLFGDQSFTLCQAGERK